MHKIEFSKEQFEALLKLVYLGDWIVNSRHEQGDENDKFKSTSSYLYSQADKFGLGHLVESDEGEIFPSAELDEDPELEECREQYDDNNFWDQLIHRLAYRDLQGQYEGKDPEKIDKEEFLHKMIEAGNRYSQTFAESGLDALQVKAASKGKGCCDHSSHSSHSHNSKGSCHN